MRLKTAAALACAAVLVLVAGCNRKSSSTHSLAFITNNASDFWTIARKGTEKADAERPDITVEFRLGDGTAAGQKRIVEDLLAKGVDGIAISPVDPANQTAMLDDAAQKTLVFTHDSDAPASKRECYVGTDNVAAGRQAGELIKSGLPQGGKIMLFVGQIDARNAQERLQG
ncbi:MAG: substrate-binding domain-containing protein, partial [Acidobacteria bacterium]|nr:substrate-binding domain-containing protein [Acidobacteriota bacterium]